MRARRLTKLPSLVVVAVVVGSLFTLPSSAHTAIIRTSPTSLQIVRALDPAQAKCTAAEWWGTATSSTENPCNVRIELDQTIGTGSTMTLAGPGGAVAGTVTMIDSTPAPSSRSLTNPDGPDTIIFTPSAALTPGDYTATAKAVSFDGHTSNCTPPRVDHPEDPGVANCHTWTFTVSPAPSTPVITSPATSEVVDHRNFVVEGTAERKAAVQVCRPAAETCKTTGSVLGKGSADANGEFHIKVALLAGANEFLARATSAAATTSERKGNPKPPVLDSATRSFSAVVTGDDQAPDIMHEIAQLLLASAPDVGSDLEGTAEDNDEVSSVTAIVTVRNFVVTGYTVTCDCGVYATWTVHIPDPGYYNVKVTAWDPSGNSSSLSTTVLVTA